MISKRLLLPVTILLLTILAALAAPGTALADPMIDFVSPAAISNDSINKVNVSGSGFVNGSVVSLEGVGNLATKFVSATVLRATVPAGVPAGTYTVKVTNPDTSWYSLPGALTITQSFTRPMIVVDNYSMNVDAISYGQDFSTRITIANSGKETASSIQVSFAAVDLVPLQSGGIVSVSDLAPGNKATFSQSFSPSMSVVGAGFVTLDMTVTYYDQAGTAYSDKFTLTLPVKPYSGSSAAATTTPTPSAVVRPQLVISAYATDVAPLQPGVQFVLKMDVRNVGTGPARRVSMIVGGGSASGGGDGTPQPGGISAGGADFTNFAPLGASNVQPLGDLAAQGLVSVNQSLIVNVTTNPGAYPMKVTFVYVDDKGVTFVDDQVITLLVFSLPTLDISFYRDPGPIYAGQLNSLPLQVVNLGRKLAVLGNMRVTASSGMIENGQMLVGNLDAGGYFTLDAGLMPDMPGPIDLTITVDYTDDFNQARTVTQVITLDVLEGYIEPPIEPGGEGGGGGEFIPPAQEETFWQKIWRFILGLFGLESAPPDGTTSPDGLPNEEQIPEPVIVPGGKGG